ncbi:MAG: hypothetical protein KJP23_03845 [Deltaproteobacteria bacterium]|nr:hypothetical protein [Deltaproteobacteria bacterium]
MLFPAQAFEKQAELKIPAAVNPGLQHLLDLADPDKKVTFDPQMIAAVLDFVETPKHNEAIYFTNIIRGLTSAYYDFDIHKNLKTIVDYAFNPDIPGIATTPSSTRIFNWIDSDGKQPTYPRVGQYLEKISSPVVFKGRQFAEITPDLTSGAYYGYNLHQILLLFKYRQRNIIVTVSKQADVSSLGKKGYVLGSDNDWDYLYSGKTGLTIPALGWVRSYMYDSRGINIYDAIDPAAPKVRCAVFKWLRAGWSGINMVQRKHIYRGLKRFAATYKEIVESPVLPSVEKLTADISRIKALSRDALRSNMQMYSKILKNRYDSAKQRSGKWPADIFDNKKHWSGMSQDEMQSVLVIEYMKYALGKTRPDEVRELLGLR